MKEDHMGSVLKHFPGYGNNEDTHVGIAYDNRTYDIVTCIDTSKPASLSEYVHRILRDKLNFKGVIITDDLLCCTDYITQIPAVHDAINNKEISIERIDESVYRILSMKIDLGIILLN